MKYFVLPALLFLCLSGFSQAKKITWVRVDINKLSLQIPDNWTYDTIPVNTTVFKAKSPLENSFDNFQENLGIRIKEIEGIDKSATLDKILDETESSLRSGLKNFSVIDKKYIIIDKEKAACLVFRSQYDEYLITQMQVYMLRGDDFYVFTLSAENSQYDLYKPVFINILRSVSLKKPGM